MDDALWLQLKMPAIDVGAFLERSPFHNAVLSTNDNALVFRFQSFLPTPPARYRCAERQLPNARFLNIVLVESDATNVMVYLMWHET